MSTGDRHAARRIRWRFVRAPLGMDLVSGEPVDPYLVWAALTGFASFNTGGGNGEVPVLLELPERGPAGQQASCGPAGVHPMVREVAAWLADHLATDAPPGAPPAEPCAAKPLPEGAAPASRYRTASVPLHWLPGLVLLVRHQLLVRFQLCAARRAGRDLQPTLRFPSLDVPQTTFRTLGLVDDGCGLAHATFRREVKDGKVLSRFLCVWDQNAVAQDDAVWHRYLRAQGADAAVRYGSELHRTDIEQHLRGIGLGAVAERAFYVRIRRPHWGRKGRTHGAAVVQLLAAPRRGAAPPAGEPDVGTMPIVFVQLPDATVSDTSGGSLGGHVLDAARYVVQRTADAVHPSTHWETTINISMGSMAGAHDGSSITECALAELAADPRVRIVMAAGNTAGKRGHAVRRVKAGRAGRFLVMAPPSNLQESYVEFWLAGATGCEDDIAVTVTSPDGLRCPPVRVGDIALLGAKHGAVQASVVFARKVVQGTEGTMVLLAIRPTSRRPDDKRSTARHGLWTVDLASRARRVVDVQAWVERNDAVIEPRRTQQAHFVHDDRIVPRPSYISDDSTLSSIANGGAVTVVGAYEQRTRRVTGYSANGPVRGQPTVDKPDLYGPSERSASCRGLRVPGFYSGTQAVLSGTSAATPRVARWIAEGCRPTEVVPVAGHGTTPANPGPPRQGIAPVGPLAPGWQAGPD